MIIHEINIWLPGSVFTDPPLKTPHLFWKLELKISRGNWFIDPELK